MKALLLLALALLAGFASEAFAADPDPIADLKAKFAAHRNSLIAKELRRLDDDLARLDQRLIALDELKLAIAVREAKAKIAAAVKSGRDLDAGFPAIDTSVAEGPKKDEALRLVAAVKEGFQDRVGRVLPPAWRIYIQKLGELEQRATLAGDLKGAVAARQQKAEAEKSFAWSELKTNIPEGAAELNGHFYLHFDGKATWHDAKNACEKLGGHLVTISSREEALFVRRLCGGKHAWIGATDEGKEGEWRWVTGEPFSFTDWGPTGPDNFQGNQHHALIWLGGKWDDYFAAEPNRYVCEWELPPSE
ncbi:MAG: C-type lectin domain-containing protein [Verrucomicrobiales bacterium]